MRTLLLLFFTVTIIFCSCHRKAGVKEQQETTPKALEEHKDISLSKRGPDDIVESLYNELKNQTPALQELAKGITAVKQQKEEAVEPFENFDQKNNNYYTAADRHIRSIRDSALKQTIQQLIRKSLDNYTSRMEPGNQLAAALEAKDVALDDLYIILKLTKTVAIMEKYQQEKLPATQALTDANRAYDSMMHQTDRLTKK